MSTIRAKLDEQVRAGRLREQCAHCEHSKEFHDPVKERCNVCWDRCAYTPAWVLRPSHVYQAPMIRGAP